MAPWNQTTEPVLRRVRKLTLIVEGQLNEPDIACANKVWAHLGVEMARYKEKDNWSFVDEEKRPQVREKLEAIFDGAAFFVDGRVANPARDKFKKADLLAWGACLLAEAAANAAVPDAEFEEALRLLAVVEPEGDEAVDAAAGNAATGAAVADRVAVVAAADSGTAFEPDDAMERDSREVSTDGRGAGPPPGAPSISSANAAAVAFKPTPQESDTCAGGLAAAGSFADGATMHVRTAERRSDDEALAIGLAHSLNDQLAPRHAPASPVGSEAAPTSAPAAANVNPDTTIEPDDAMECDSREESADGRGAGPPPGVEASASIIPVDVVAAAAVAPSVPLRRAAPFATRTLDEVSAVRRRIVANFEASPVAVPPPGAEAPPSISSEDSTSLRRSVRKGFARRTGRSGFFSGKGRLTAEAVASLNSCPSSVASNANHNRTATSFTQSRSDRSPWDRISYHSSQLSAKLARSFPSRKKAYVRPPSVLADELDEIETWQRIDAKVIEAMRMREKIVGRDSTLDAVEREDRISEEAKHKTIVDEMREVMDAVELGDCELAEQRVDSLQMHLHTQLSTSRITRKVRDAVVELKDLELKDCEFAEQRIDRLLFCWSTVMLSAREQGPLSTLDAMEFSDRRGTAMADEP